MKYIAAIFLSFISLLILLIQRFKARVLTYKFGNNILHSRYDLHLIVRITHLN